MQATTMDKLKRNKNKNKNKNKNSWFTIYFLGGIVGVPMSVMCQFWIAFLEMDFRRYKDFPVNGRKLDVHFWKLHHSTNGVSVNFFFLFLFWSRRWAMLLFSITAGSLLFFFFFFFKGDQVYVRFDWDCEGLK